jgi:flagellar hook assembly protein FlgD
VRYTLPIDSYVVLSVRDIAGREVFSRQIGMQPAGSHVARWNGDRATGGAASPGIYFMTVRAGAANATQKFVVAR